MSKTGPIRRYTSRKSRTVNGRDLHRDIRNNPVEYPNGISRPASRGECADGPRPCPWVSCRYHLYLDITPYGGLTLNYPSIEPGQMEHSCALDIAAQGDHDMISVAQIMGVNDETVRVIERAAKVKMWASKNLRPFRNAQSTSDNEDEEGDYVE